MGVIVTLFTPNRIVNHHQQIAVNFDTIGYDRTDAYRLSANIDSSTVVDVAVAIIAHTLGIAIPGSRDSGPLFNPKIPGLCETKSRDFRMKKITY